MRKETVLNGILGKPLEVGTSKEYWQGVIGISGRLQMLLKSVPAEIAAKIKLAVTTAAEGYRSGGWNRIPCEEVVGAAWR